MATLVTLITHTVRIEVGSGHTHVAGYLVREAGRDLGYVWPVYHSVTSPGRTVWGWQTPNGEGRGEREKKQGAIDVLRDFARLPAERRQAYEEPRQGGLFGAARALLQREQPVVRGEGFTMTSRQVAPPPRARATRREAEEEVRVDWSKQADVDVDAMRERIKASINKHRREP